MKGARKPASRAEIAPDLSPSSRSLEDAKAAAGECTSAMMAELALRHPAGDVQGIAFALAKFQHPTGEHPFAVWATYTDNLDPVFADTFALGALVDFINALAMPFDMRAELARRIVMQTDTLPDAGRFVAGEVLGGKRR